MGGFNWWCQSDLLVPYIDRYFTILPDIFRNMDKVFSLDFARAMMPVYRVERDVLARSEEVLREIGDTLPSLTRVLKEANDDLLRAIKCREFAAG